MLHQFTAGITGRERGHVSLRGERARDGLAAGSSLAGTGRLAESLRESVVLRLEEFHRRIPEYKIPEGADIRFSPGIRQADGLPLVWDPVS